MRRGRYWEVESGPSRSCFSRYYRGLVGGLGFGTPVVSYAPRPMFIVAGVTLMIIEVWVCLGAY